MVKMLANNKKKIKLKLKSNNNKINYKNTKEKGDIYEKYIYYNLLETNKYKNVWLWKNVPEYYLLKSGIMDNWNNARLIRKKDNIDNLENRLPDFATDLFTLEQDDNNNDKYSIIQCKNYDDSRKLRPEHLGTFYFMMYRYSRYVNGLVFHTNDLCENLLNHSNTNDNIKYNRVSIEEDKYELYNLDKDLNIDNIEINENNSILEPFQYQIDAYEALKGKHRTVLQMACGTGKTLVSILLAKDYKQNIIISPLKAYCEQNMERFTSQMPEEYKMLIIDGDNDGRNIHKIIEFIKNNEKICLFVTYKSIDIINKLISYVDDNNDIKLLNDYFVIIDEFHNISYQDVYELYDISDESYEENISDNEEDEDEEDESDDNSDEEDDCKEIKQSQMYNLLHSDSRIMCMSATPKLFGDNLDSPDDIEINNDIFGNIDYTYSMSSAIDEGRICDYKIFVPTLHIPKETGIDLLYDEANLKDYDKELVIKARYVIKGMMEIGSRKCIIYLQSQNECREMTNIIKEQCKNYFAISNNCNYIISSDLKNERKDKLKSFIQFNGYSFLCSVDILNECIDIPKCDSIFIAYPSKSKIRNIQRLCRANRKDKENPNKIANIFLWCDDYKNDLVDFISHIKEYDSKFTFNKINRLNVSNDGKTLMMPEIESNENKELENIVVGFRCVDNFDSWLKKFEELKKYIDENKKRPSYNSTDKYIKIMASWNNKNQTNFNRKVCIMQNETIYKLWEEFINNDKYKAYYINPTIIECFNNYLNKFKEYINIYKNIPSTSDKNKDIKLLGRWFSSNKTKYRKKINIMKNKTIYKIWTDFMNDIEYKIYFLSQYEKFVVMLHKISLYMDTNKKRPSITSKDKNIKFMGQWISTQIQNNNTNTKKMKNINIKNKWESFINEEKYKVYFESNEELFNNNLIKLKKFIDENNKRPSSINDRYLNNWFKEQNSNYIKKDKGMKNENMYKKWHEFINDNKYKIYFQTMEELFDMYLNKLKNYIDINKNRPTHSDKEDKDVVKLAKWYDHQSNNYIKKIENMKNNNIYKKWTDFNNKYGIYFISREDEWKLKFNNLKLYIDKYEKRPNKNDVNKDIKNLGIWAVAQLQAYKSKIYIMKEENIRKNWQEFINDDKYKKYF